MSPTEQNFPFSAGNYGADTAGHMKKPGRRRMGVCPGMLLRLFQFPAFPGEAMYASPQLA